jgi:hypothetical protein
LDFDYPTSAALAVQLAAELVETYRDARRKVRSRPVFIASARLIAAERRKCLTLTLRQPSMLTGMSIPPTTHQTGQPAIRVRGMEKSFKDVKVLRGVDIDVARGSIFALLGGQLVDPDRPAVLRVVVGERFLGQRGRADRGLVGEVVAAAGHDHHLLTAHKLRGSSPLTCIAPDVPPLCGGGTSGVRSTAWLEGADDLEVLVDEDVVRPVDADVVDLVLTVAQLHDTVDDAARVGGQRGFRRLVRRRSADDRP